MAGHLSLDGYGSHVNTLNSLKTFAENKIFILKEEGDLSQTNQAYDQSKAKEDKNTIG